MTHAKPPEDVDDAVCQRDVLTVLLHRHPAQTSLDELHRELAEATYGPYVADDVERATRDLVHAGLLHRHGDFVFPTVAAVRYAELPS